MSETTIISSAERIIWQDIQEFEGYYQISNHGLVKGLKRTIINRTSLMNVSEIILKPHFDKDCYLHVSLARAGMAATLRIHRLVALAFLPNPFNLPVPDHINGIRWDNRVENLRWSTHSDNVQSQFDRGRPVSTSRPVNQYTINGEFVQRFEAIRHVEKQGFDSKKVNACVLNQRKSCGGFIWKYAE